MRQPQKLAARCASRAAPLLLATVVLVLLPAAASAQAVDTVGMRRGGVGVHALAGAFVGRIDMTGGGVSDLAGLRGGIGFGEIVDITGFYWRSIDTDEREFLADRAYGGEARFALNAGFGVTPFVTVGLGRLSFEDADARTAAIAGAGLQLPLGPVLLSASARDYILGVAGLDDADDEEVTHNWLYSAGVTIGLGRSRRTDPIVVQRPPAPPPVVVATPAEAGERAPAVTEAREGVRNFQSGRTIEVPIPLEGSITLRYGPGTATESTDARPVAAVAPAAPEVATSLAADPVMLAWVRQLVGAEVAAQLGSAGAQPTPAPGTTTIIPMPGDAGVSQRAFDSALAALLLRMQAMDAQRTSELRGELRRLIASEFAALRGESVPGVAAPPLAVAPPAPLTPAPRVGVVVPRDEPRPSPANGTAAARAAADRGRADAELRLVLAGAAARHPAVLSTVETPRGPGIVVADVAFRTGEALLDTRARAAVDAVAAALREVPARRVFVHGHTDSVGTESSNQLLSELRAEAVRSLLVQAGIDPASVHAVGFGEGWPIAGNETEAGRALNRRVEIVVGDPVARADGRVVMQEMIR